MSSKSMSKENNHSLNTFSYGIQYYAIYLSTEISEKHSAPIFKVEKKVKQEANTEQAAS
jgi:hypothetical protein